jgi:hypothetical protein
MRYKSLHIQFYFLVVRTIFAGVACLASSAIFVTAAYAQADQGQPQTPALPEEAQNQQPVQQQQQQGPPPYLDLVYDEDWSHLKDSKAPPDFFDPIKYIPFSEEGWYLSLGGEIRERYDSWHQANFGYTPAPYLNDNLERYLFDADLHMGKHFRFFTQVQSSLEFGKAGGPWYGDRDTFEFHQFFLDIRSSDDPKHYTLLRVGRQEVSLGADHFVSTGDFFNARHVFDGARLTVQRGDWTWLLEATKPDLVEDGAFDDVPEHGRTSWGGGFFHPSPLTKQGRVGVFYIGLDTKQQLWQRGLGRDQRQTVGARMEGNPRGWDYAYEGLFQFGTFTEDFGPSMGIRAWALTSDTGYTFFKNHHYPRIAIRSNITSGDGGHGSLGTFHPLFPDTAYSGKLGLVGPSNVIDVTPAFRFAATRRIYVLNEWSFFWRENTHDAIYSPAVPTTSPLDGIINYIEKPGNYSSARYIGNQIEIAAQITIDRHLTYSAGYNYFTLGAFLKQTPPAQATGYFVTWFTYKF